MSLGRTSLFLLLYLDYKLSNVVRFDLRISEMPLSVWHFCVSYFCVDVTYFLIFVTYIFVYISFDVVNFLKLN